MERHIGLEAVVATLTHIWPPRDPPGRAAAASELKKYLLILRLSEYQLLIVLINNIENIITLPSFGQKSGKS